MPKLELTPIWDKVFPQSDAVEHSKITFHNRYGIELAADLYKPKDATGPFAAIAISGPFGAVKEQSSGLYAQTLAERGFLTLAFDPSFTGESGGDVRYMAAGEFGIEDFSAAVDYLSCRNDVDPERIGILGICGWGGMALAAAANDPRIKATVASTMYDMSRVAANGYFDADDNPQARNQARAAMAAQRTADYQSGNNVRGGGVVDPLPDDAPYFVKDYHTYYKTPRGYHARSLNSNDGWAVIGQWTLGTLPLLTYIGEIERPVLIVHGEKAHSRYFGETAYERMKAGIAPDNKELLIIPGASHTDLYDQVDIIPFDTIQEFFTTNL
ncbi:alpha/beta hydrolase [Anaerotardibacter muris]|uniref:alpha/beta hydrolase n=1 Tax=Anaerotardibacter muris TaxID=2941505 RepID=UPI00203C3EA4|nr:alpha/beta hydrolase [Anaerotardibacter muris]